MERLKDLAAAGLLSLWLTASSPEPLNSSSNIQENSDNPHRVEVTDDEYLRQAMIQSIYEKYGIEIIADHDPEITNMLSTRNPNLAGIKNYAPSIDMVRTAEYVFNLLPSAGYFTQKVVFLEPPPNLNEVRGGYIHSLQSEGWILLFHKPAVPLQRPFPGAHLLDIPNHGTAIALTLAHELGHGLHSNILYLQSYDLDQYTRDLGSKNFNPNDPILRTFSLVAGFEYIEPLQECTDEEEDTICWTVVQSERNPGNALWMRNLQGWVRTEESMKGKIITPYAKYSTPSETFAEDFMANLLQPEFYDDNRLHQYFRNLFEGLNTETDPGHFLLAIAQDPEGILLKGINFDVQLNSDSPS